MQLVTSPKKLDHHQFEIASKVKRHLESSQNISLLNEYCQKTARSLPEWTPMSTPQNLGYSHGMQLLIDGQKFECNGATSRQEAKKSCATAAIEYFEKNKVPFFINRRKNYTSLLHQLCQAAGIENPEFRFQGSTSFTCQVFVYDREYGSKFSHTKKNTAKEDASRVAFEELCLLSDISSTIFMSRPSMVTQVTRQESASVKRQEDTKRKGDDDPPQVTFKDLLWQYYETRSELGKPFYNYRPVTESDGSTSYRAQLIMGGKTKVSQLHPSQSDAAEQVSKEMFIEIHPNANEIIGNMNRYVEQEQAKKRVKEGDVYYSDDELQLPSYEQKLRELLIEQQSPEPVFTYVKGELGGYLCSGMIKVRSIGQMQTMVSLREHASKGTAREDVSHDLFVLLRSYSS